MSDPPGRRERKKRQTRQSISVIATDLFLEKGFDVVTVAEVAAAADVAVQTVFNHFPTKEDLFFDDTTWVEGPADAVRAAGPGVPVATTMAGQYRRHLREMRALGYVKEVVRYTSTLESSTALRARRAYLGARMEELLAEAIAGGPADWRSRLAAAQYAEAGRVLDTELVLRLAGGTAQPESVLDEIEALVDEAYGVPTGPAATVSAIS